MHRHTHTEITLLPIPEPTYRVRTPRHMVLSKTSKRKNHVPVQERALEVGSINVWVIVELFKIKIMAGIIDFIPFWK